MGRKKNKMPRILWVFVIITILPFYIISELIFKTAIMRDNKSFLMENKLAKKLKGRADYILMAIKNGWKENTVYKERGKSFSDFSEEMEQGRKWFYAQNREKITMTSHDGLSLTAYYLPSEESTDKIMILMHGYRNDGLGDFSGLVKFYHDMGYHILAPHQRSHGESEGEYITYGVKERFDVKQWAEYIEKRFEGNCRIFLLGISMGGASVLMASGLKLPKQVKGIIADCAFTSPWEIISFVMENDCYIPRVPFLYAGNIICRVKAGFGLKECSTLDCMKENKIPVLFIHGGRDSFVPTRMSYENYEACIAPKQIFIVDSAAHGTSHLVEPEKYRSVVFKFIQKWEG